MPSSARPSGSSLVVRLFALARPEWRRLSAGAVLILLESALGLLFPQGARMAMDAALGGKAPFTSGTLALVTFGLAVLLGLAISVRGVLVSVAGERIVLRLRESLYARVLDQEIAFFDARRVGEIGSRLSADTVLVQWAVSNDLATAVRSVVQSLGGVALLLVTSPRLAAVMLAVVPAIAVGSVVWGRHARRLSRLAQDALSEAAGVADESLAAVRTVRSFAAEAIERERYGASLRRWFSLSRTRIVAASAFNGGSSFSAYAAGVLVFWYGSIMVARGQLSLGALTSFLMYTLLVGLAIVAVADHWAAFMRAAGSAERVFELLDRAPLIPPTGGLAPTSAEGRVEFRGVTFSYPTRPDVQVLRGLDLSIAPGEIVAIVGPSGAGKSTIAALLSRFYDPNGGAIFFDGHDLRELDGQWLHHHVGKVAQEPVLFSTTIGDNIRYGRRDASGAEIEAAARAAHAHTFITGFPQGYDTPVGERGVQLSGGQKQRIAIARAVLKDPTVLILDEATSALDAESEHLVQQALDDLMRGRTTVVIAHRLSTVKAADRVVVLDGGRVVQSGPHAQLMAEDGLYRRLCERQLVQ